MAHINQPTQLLITNEEVHEVIRQLAIKKLPALEDEEFEMDVALNSYDKTISVKIQSL